MVVGRETELRHLAGRVAAARLKRGGVLVVSGEAGVGKSTLLAECAAMAAGAQVVRVLGTSAEQEVPYSALGLVLGDLTDDLPPLPVPQAQALGVALAVREGEPPSAFAVGAATLGVLTRRADARPLVLLLDDAHLLDLPSARALAFAGRRLASDPVLVVAAVRSNEHGPWAHAGFPELVLAGLDDEAVGALLRELGVTAGPEYASRARAATGGNPLAVTELLARPDAPALVALDGPVPLPESLVGAFSERARALGPDVQLVVALAALSGTAASVATRAASVLGLPSDALYRAERSGLVRLEGGRLSPSHPLVGSAVYSSLAPADRRRVHAAVARVLPPGRVDERVRHLAAATAGPDEALAASLEEVAVRAARRGADAVAASGLERAAGITPGQDRRVERLLAAAGHAWAAGDAPWASRLCRTVVRESPALRLARGGPHGHDRGADRVTGPCARLPPRLVGARHGGGPGGGEPDRCRARQRRLLPR